MFILKGHKDPVVKVAFSPDGGTLLSMDRMDRVRTWDLAGGRLRWELDKAFYASVAFTPDGRHVMTCDNSGTLAINQNGDPRSDFDRANPILIHDTSTGVATRAPLRHDSDQALHDLRFAPGGTRCVGRDGRDATDLRWWNYPSGEPLPSWKDVIPSDLLRFGAMTFSPDGRRLVGMNGQGVSVFDTETGALLFRHPYRLVQDECRLAFHPDSKRLAVASGTRLAILDLETRIEIAEAKLAKKYFLGMAFTPDGGQLATVSNEETVKMWDTRDCRLIREYAWDVGGLRCVAIARDGLTAAAGGMGKKVVVWDVEGDRATHAKRADTSSRHPGTAGSASAMSPATNVVGRSGASER